MILSQTFLKENSLSESFTVSVMKKTAAPWSLAVGHYFCISVHFTHFACRCPNTVMKMLWSKSKNLVLSSFIGNLICTSETARQLRDSFAAKYKIKHNLGFLVSRAQLCIRSIFLHFTANFDFKASFLPFIFYVTRKSSLLWPTWRWYTMTLTKTIIRRFY